MRRNLTTVILVPCILSLILAVLIILDKKNISLIPVKGKGPKKTVVSVSITPTPGAGPTQLPEITEEPTPEPVPTEVPTQSPTIPATSKPSPTPVPTPTLAPTPTTAPKVTEPAPEPSVTPENNQKPAEVTYNAIYKLDGSNYSLIADGNSLTFLVLNNKDNSIRQTGYPFHSKYAQHPGNFTGPILGYKNNSFVFISDKQIVMSDGTQERVLAAINDDVSSEVNIGPVIQSNNRILVGIEGKLMYVIDLRNFNVEIYNETYSDNYFVLTDETLSFSKKHRIPAGPYYQFLYTARNGKTNLLAMIGEIQNFTVNTENSIVTIKADNTYQLDLKTDKLSTSRVIDKERTLYIPAYADGIIGNLTDIRFINRNSSDEQVILKLLPVSYKADCYYSSYYNTFFFTFYQPEKAHLLPGSAGSFTVIDYSVISLNENKFLRDSTVKELLYSGQTSIGNAEVYLLERYETLNGESTTFELVYAWVPIKNSTKAYQLYLYVPRGENYEPYLNLVKQLIS